MLSEYYCECNKKACQLVIELAPAFVEHRNAVVKQIPGYIYFFHPKCKVHPNEELVLECDTFKIVKSKYLVPEGTKK